MLQKEEERARRKIDLTKERASEILAMRNENEKRMHAYMDASGEEKALQRELQERNKEQEIETKRALASQAHRILSQRREDAHMLNMEKKNMTKQLIKDQEKELRLKQKKRDEVRRMEDEARLKREEEKRESDRRMRELNEQKAAAEEAEAMRAEKLVRALERREREWMNRLQEAQNIQEAAFGHLEYALLRENNNNEDSRGGSRERGEREFYSGSGSGGESAHTRSTSGSSLHGGGSGSAGGSGSGVDKSPPVPGKKKSTKTTSR